MKNLLAKAGLAIMMVVGTVMSAVPANAGGLDVEIQIGGPRVYHRPRVIYREPVVIVRPRPRYIYEEPIVVVRPRRGCNEELAVSKARRSGMRRAYVSNVSSSRVVVFGFFRGHEAKMFFANRRGCPAL